MSLASMPQDVVDSLKHVTCSRGELPLGAEWPVAAAIAAPHFLYAFIWLLPKVWQRAFGSHAVDVFAACGAAGKLIQFSTLALWIKAVRPNGLCFDPTKVELSQFLTALVLFAAGQSLNVGIFKAIGTAGVYYGTRLGHKVPWVEGWPFNVVSHPQYVGSVLTVWALGILLYTQVPAASIAILVTFWTILYIISGALEQYF